MSILPTWPIAAGALVIGLAVGAFIDHRIMQGRIDKITIAHTEELRVREVKRADDERAERSKEQAWNFKLNEVEQRRIDEVDKVRGAADALAERMRKQANSKSSNASGVRPTCPTSEGSTGADVPIRIGDDLVRLAQRADEQREALKACYSSYDSIQAR